MSEPCKDCAEHDLDVCEAHCGDCAKSDVACENHCDHGDFMDNHCGYCGMYMGGDYFVGVAEAAFEGDR